MVCLVTLDQSAAFDVVDHLILREKLQIYRFDDHSLNWYMQYLEGRSQYVDLQTSRSEGKNVGPFACPQGSCLGPLT